MLAGPWPLSAEVGGAQARKVPASLTDDPVRQALSAPWFRRHPRALMVLAVVISLGLVWGVKLVGEYRGIERAKDYWSMPQGEPGGLLYVALGDSTAQGIGASRPERGYVGLLAERLRQQSHRPVRVVNLSVTGAKVGDVLRTQIPALRRLKPDVVTVAIGANDVRSFNSADFAHRIQLLTAQLPAGTFIADIPWFMSGAWERHAVQAGQEIERDSAAHGLTLVPLHEAMSTRGWSSMLSDFAPDWFHPNDRGYVVWADAFWAAMSKPGSLITSPQRWLPTGGGRGGHVR